MFKMPHSTRHLSSGFSLVEIMVGMVLGMLGMIVMMQVYSVSEGQKRSATGASDAQNNGAIALYGMQRDLRQAGYGFAAMSMFGCNVTMPSGTTIPWAPVIINPAPGVIPAGDANSDTLLVIYGNTDGAPQGDAITAAAGPAYTVNTPGSYAVNDYVIAAPAACVGNLIFDRVAATGAVVAGFKTNPVTVANGPAGAAVTTLYNLGQAPRVQAYAIRGGNLTVCDYVANNCAGSVNNTAIWVPIANNIVNLRAQYGRDTATVAIAFASPPVPLPNYVVDTYDQATPSAATVPPSPCGWARTSAVRIALTARSQQYVKEIVTTNAPTWEGSTGVTGSAIGLNNPTALPIDLSGNPDWQHYRYKVFQTVVPLRNITWMGVQSGC